MQELSTWPIYIVSLRRAAERRERCARRMAELGLRFEFFDAVEGAALSQQDLAAVYDAEKNARAFKRPLSPPEMGCSLSHFALWQRIAAGAAGGAVILEDDFDAEDGFPQLLQKLCSTLDRANAAHCTPACMVKFFSLRAVNGPAVTELGGGYRLTMPDRVPGLTLGYAVDRDAAVRLAAKALPLARPIDMEIKHWWTFDVPVLVVVPSPLRLDLKKTGSSIEAARSQTQPRGQLSWLRRMGRNVRYQMAFNVGVWRSRRQRREHLRRLRACVAKAGPPAA